MKNHMKLITLLLLPIILFSLPVSATDIQVNVLDNEQKNVKDIVVYLEPVNTANHLPRNAKTLEIGQLDRAFTPYISVIQVGNEVLFNNRDDITHHIYSPIGENKFEFKLRSGDSKVKKDFNNTGEVVMGCNIHDWMSGYLLILETPYFAKTSQQGMAHFTVQTNGQYRLTVWHPQLELPEHKFTQLIQVINENKTITVNLTGNLQAIPEQTNEDDFDFLSDY